ncbi:hypothetical protein BDW68DRAFT_174759 [Aspergillus falconensis]
MGNNRPYEGPLTRARKRKQLAAESGSSARDTKRPGIVGNSRKGTETDLASPATISDHEAPLDSSSGSAALSRVVELFIQPLSSVRAEWHALRSLLFLLRFGSAASPHRDPAVVGALDRTQTSVLALLEEWWTGRVHDTALPEIKRFLFLDALSFENTPDNEVFSHQLRALTALVFEEDLPFLHGVARIHELFLCENNKRYNECLQIINGNWNDSMESHYHRNMADLFMNELYPTPLAPLPNLKPIREIAGQEAASERIGFHALMHFSSCMDGSAPNSCSFASSKQSKLKDFPRPISSLIDPCYWLRDNQADGLPQYLWDINLCRTVKAAEIPPENIRYAIVSHTWGRMREENAMEYVCGVPWQVPKITRYDVKELPRMIMDAGFSEPYIWLDLFCIPQEMSVDWQLEICKAELPRQVAIFRNSSTAVAWLNDVASWDNTRAAVAWLGLKDLSKDPTTSVSYKDLVDVEKALDAAARSASGPCDLDLMKETTVVEEGVKESSPPAWLTSLWTLQEMMIRPDMIFLDKHWRPLTVGDQLLVTLDGLTSLVIGLSGDAVQDAPKGVATLISVIDEHMQVLWSGNRISALILGAHRVSTSPRAPAIMSVLGATEWFRGRTLQQFQSPEEADQLVLGSYPLDFVEEICDRSGAAFFSCQTNIATLVMREPTGTVPAPGYPLRGTMLPFMPSPVDKRKGYIHPKPETPYDVDHPSVRSWRVQRDGSVVLPTVAIIASNSIELQTTCELECAILSNDPENTTLRYAVSPQNQVPLHDWIRKFSGQAHAICTMFSHEQLAGIILHRVKAGDSFVKAGSFSAGWPYQLDYEETGIDPSFVTVLDVEWHVL